MREMVRRKTKRICNKQAGPSIQEAVEDTLSDNFIGRFEKAKTELKSASYYFVEGVLTEMARKYSMEDMFERNVERWTHSSSFMDTFTQRFLNSPCFI